MAITWKDVFRKASRINITGIFFNSPDEYIAHFRRIEANKKTPKKEPPKKFQKK